MEARVIANPGELEGLDGFGFVAADAFVATCDALLARGEPGDEAAVAALLDAAAILVSVSPKSSPDVKRRSVRAMTLGHFARLWRGRSPSAKTFDASRLQDACTRLGALLAPIVAERRPPPLEIARLAAVRIGVLRRRLDNFAPSMARELTSTFAFVEHGQRLGDWVRDGPSLGLTGELRARFDTMVRSVAEAERESVAPRQRRRAALAGAAAARAHLDAVRALAEGLASAPEPVEVARRDASAHFDAQARRLTVQSPHWLACLESSGCTTVTVDLAEPLAPKVACGYRDAPCSLKRMALEVLAESVAGIDEGAVPVEGREELGRWCTSSASERLLARLDALGRELGVGREEDGQLAWLLTPYERLDLVRITAKKKGGLKSKRLAQGDALRAIENPRHAIVAAMLRALGIFQERRFSAYHAAYGLDALGPALAALAGDDAVYVLFEGEPRKLAVSVAVPRLDARLDAEMRAGFVLTLAGRPLERLPLTSGWVGHLDLQAGTLVLGHVSDALRTAATLTEQPPVPVEEPDKERFAERLLSLERRVPIEADKSWLGEEVASELGWVLQLVWSGPTKKGADGSGGRALEARLRVRIVPELGALLPGDGERVLPLKRVGPDGVAHLKHVERDFSAERQAGVVMAEALGLGWPGSAGEWDWRFVALEEALTFLDEAQTCQAEGRVELVWDGRPVQLSQARATERLQLKLGFRRDWLDVRGGYLLDGGELPLKELLNALREGKRFVQVDEARFVELSVDLRRSLAPLAALARESAGKVVASPLAVPLVDELADAGVQIEAPPEWLTLSTRMHEATRLEPALPAGLEAELRPYQIDGFRWLARLSHWARGACLADDMGLGKTLQALTLVLHRAALGPTLVVAPTSVTANWVREAARFAPGLVVKRALAGGAIDEALAASGPGTMLVTTWDLMARHERLARAPGGEEGRPWATVVLDEAHAIKNAATRRAKAARDLEAEFALALTGTPVENRPLELWSLFSVVAPGLLGSLESFRELFGRDVEARTEEGTRRLSRLIRPFLLRRTKSEVAPELPPKSEVRVDVVLARDERERYQRVRMAAIAELDALGPEALEGQKGMMRVLAVLTRLRQLACHPRLVDPKAPSASSKLDRLVELAQELADEGRKMLIFSQFVELLGLVKRALSDAGLSFAYLDGSTPAVERVREVDRFQAGEVDCFLLSLKAGGVGLNLTTATEVIHLDPWWNPAVEDQASDRAHRIGQERPVTVYRMVASGTIEEQILGLHAEKRAMVSALLAGTDSARPLSAEDLSALLSAAEE